MTQYKGENIDNFKIILVGDSSVGKSSMVHRLIYDKFQLFVTPTIGASFFSKKIKIDDNTVCRLNIWDTAGQERYHSISKVFYKNAFGCIVVFDVCNRQSFERVKFWLDDIKQNNSFEEFSTVIVANKTDVNKEKWQVNVDEIQTIADEYQCNFIYTSSVTGHGIQELFINLAKQIYSKKKDNIILNTILIQNDDIAVSNLNSCYC